MKLTFLYPLLIASSLLSCVKTSKTADVKLSMNEEARQPNVIIILVDDAGFVDFGFMGSKDLPTPNIDKLAENGVIFSDAHVTSTVCAPSRAGLMTGQYQQRFGFEANGTEGIGLSDDVVTMADVFKAGGYQTYAIGKWHLGEEQASDHPNKRGFDEFYGFLAGGRSYFPMKKPSVDHMLQHNGERVEFDGYLTDVLGDQSVNYLKEAAQREKPFFMYLAYNAVHTPMEAKEVDLKRFEGHSRQTLAAMTWSLDENVGKLRAALKETNEFDNTLIFFLSDNGGAHNNDSQTGPLKGWKGNEFEGGHRVPFVVSWPGELSGGKTYDGLTSSLDIFSTSIAVAGLTAPASHKLDGVDLIPFLKGQKQTSPHAQLFWRKLEESAVRSDKYKLISLQGKGTVLYNLKDDLGESKDLKLTQSAKNNELKEALKHWENDKMEPLWGEGDDWMRVTYHIHDFLMDNKTPLYKAPNEMKKVSK